MSEEQKPGENYNPFDQNVKQRDYTKPISDGNILDIPEAVFNPPSMEELREGLNEKLNPGKDSSSNEPANNTNPASNQVPASNHPAKEKFSANPTLNDLDDGDKHKAAATLVDAALDGYGRLNSFASGAIKFPMRKIKKMERNGEINTSILLPIDNQQVPMKVFMETYNESVSDVFEVSDEFKKKVRPVAIRLAKKYNFGMSDEGLLAYYLGLDITSKVAIGRQLYIQMKEMLEDFKEGSLHYAKEESGRNFTQASKEQPEPKKPDSPQPEMKSNIQNDAPESNFNPKSEILEPNYKREFVEPEEMGNKPTDTTTFSEPLKVSNSDKKTETIVPDTIIPPGARQNNASMPEFGDKNILSQMDQIDKKSKGKGKRK